MAFEHLSRLPREGHILIFSDVRYCHGAHFPDGCAERLRVDTQRASGRGSGPPTALAAHTARSRQDPHLLHPPGPARVCPLPDRRTPALAPLGRQSRGKRLQEYRRSKVEIVRDALVWRRCQRPHPTRLHPIGSLRGLLGPAISRNLSQSQIADVHPCKQVQLRGRASYRLCECTGKPIQDQFGSARNSLTRASREAVREAA